MHFTNAFGEGATRQHRVQTWQSWQINTLTLPSWHDSQEGHTEVNGSTECSLLHLHSEVREHTLLMHSRLLL